MANQTAATGGGTRARDRMIADNLALVHHMARRMAGPATNEADYDDMVSAGSVGLIAAVENFEPELGYSFSTYAAPRIRGAILDDLRRKDPATRGMRDKRRRIARARASAAAGCGENPTDRAVARELGIDLTKLWSWEVHVQSSGRVSMDRPLGHGEEEGATIRDVLQGPGTDEVEADVHRRELGEQLEAALLALPDQDRSVLALYYFEELKLREIGEVLGLTESRISQIRTRALAALRDMAPGLSACVA